MRAALYPRVSGEKQVREGYGLSYQEADLRREADKRGFEVVEVVTEPAFERSEFHRPGLERLRELAKAGEIDCVLAWKRDRYFAGPGLRALFEKEMELYGVKLLAMDDSGGDSPEDSFADGIKDLLAQLEVAKTRERTISGTRQKVLEGKVIIPARPNYGFKPDEDRDHYEVDEPAAKVVRRIFSDVAGGESLRAVTNSLNREGIPSPTGSNWTRQVIRQLLLEDSYRPHTLEELRELGVAENVLKGLDPDASYGVWYYNRRRKETWRDPVTFKKRSKTITRPKEEWLAVPVPDVGVGRDVVEAARKRVRPNTRSSRASGRVWELDSGVLRCGVCGRALVPRNTPDPRGRVRNWYVCGDYATTPKERRCPGVKHHRAEPLEAVVAEKLTEWFSDPEQAERYILERVEAARRTFVAGDPEVQAKAHSDQVAKIERMKANYRRQQAEELITLEDLKKVLSELDAQESEAKAALEKLKDRHKHLEELENEAKIVLALFYAYASYDLATLLPERRREIYAKLSLTVTVWPDGTLEISGAPDANYVPAADPDTVETVERELSKARGARGEAEEDRLQKRMNSLPFIRRTIEPP